MFFLRRKKVIDTYMAGGSADQNVVEPEQDTQFDRYFAGHPTLAGCQNPPATGYPPNTNHHSL